MHPGTETINIETLSPFVPAGEGAEKKKKGKKKKGKDYKKSKSVAPGSVSGSLLKSAEEMKDKLDIQVILDFD